MAPNPTGYAEEATGSASAPTVVTPGVGWDASGVARETGGHLEEAADHAHSIDGKITACNTAAIAGSVTANAGTNLNTSTLALESGKLTQHGAHLGVGGQVIAIGAAAVRSTQMAAGTWRISGSGDVWFKQGTVAVTASAAATSTFLAAGAVETFIVANAAVDDYVSVIQDGAETGNVSITKIF